MGSKTSGQGGRKRVCGGLVVRCVSWFGKCGSKVDLVNRILEYPKEDLLLVLLRNALNAQSVVLEGLLLAYADMKLDLRTQIGRLPGYLVFLQLVILGLGVCNM